MNNQKLNALVSGMLASAKNRQANILNVKLVKDLSLKIEKSENEKFLLTLELGQTLFKGREQFDLFCKAIQNKAKDEGMNKPTKDEIIPLVFGFEKSQYHKYCRIGGLPNNVVNKFNDKCEEARKQGIKPQQSIEALETWGKNFDSHKGNSDVTKEAILDLREDSTKDKKQAVWSVKQGNKIFTMYADKSHTTNFTASEIRELLDEQISVTLISLYPIKKTTTKKETARLERTQKERIAKIANGLN